MAMQALTPADMTRICLKRKWWILACLATFVLLAYGVWTVFPKSYKSTVVLTLDSPRIHKDYVNGLPTGERPHIDPTVHALQQVTVGLTSRGILIPILETFKPYAEKEGANIDSLLKALRKNIIVGKPKDGVGVAISYTHSDPHVAQGVAALLAMKLQEDTFKRREGMVENTTEFISSELDKIKVDLEAKERVISDFKRSHMGELPQQMEANLRALDRLQTDLTSTNDSLNKLGDRLLALDKAIKEYSELGAAATILPDRERRMGDPRPVDPRIARLRELKQKLNEISALYKDNYPDIVYLKEEVKRLETSLAASPATPVAEGLPGGETQPVPAAVAKAADPYLRELMKERNEAKSEMAFLKDKQVNTTRQIREIEGRVERTPAREQSLAMLLRDYDNLQKSYQVLLEKRNNARILENYEAQRFGEEYRIIEAANLPEGPEPPTRLHFLLGGLLLGCLVGFGSAIGTEFMKVGFRRPEEAEQYLGVPVIASIPGFASVVSGLDIMRSRGLLMGPQGSTESAVALSAYPGYPIRQKKAKLGDANGRGGPGSGLPPKFHLITKWSPASLMAEQYRVAATRLLLMSVEKKHAVTLITSSVMGEGKTTTALNLAYVLAHDLGKSTLLIDCDFKRPMVHQYAGISSTPGLANVIQGVDLLENCLHQYEELPLWILPVGLQGKRPVGLSGIQYLKTVLPDLRARYDHIILDAPPILPLADVNVLTDMADTLAFVVRAGGTSKDVVKKALQSIGEVGEAGIILTQVEMEYAPYFMYTAPYTAAGEER